MAATLVASPPDEAAEHVFEVKYDGIRALAAVSGGHVAMWTRNALDLAGRCPEIASALAGLDVDEAVLDGEVVALDEQGVSRFQLLPGVEHVQVLFVFDLLWHDGEDLRPAPASNAVGGPDLVSGLVKIENRLIAILDLGALFPAGVS